MESKEEIQQRFGEHLTRLREGKGISIRELAARANLEYSQVQRIEKGKVNLSLSTIVALSEGLGISKSKVMDF